MVITEDRASVKLLTASKVKEMELERIPTPALKPAKKRLAKIPIILVCTMTFSLFSCIEFPLLSISKRCFSEALPPACQKACL